MILLNVLRNSSESDNDYSFLLEIVDRNKLSKTISDLLFSRNLDMRIQLMKQMIEDRTGLAMFSKYASELFLDKMLVSIQTVNNQVQTKGKDLNPFLTNHYLISTFKQNFV